jgi:hypothetical protein
MLRHRFQRTEQRWTTLQPFITPLVVAEAATFGKDVDELLGVWGLSTNVESYASAAATRVLDLARTTVTTISKLTSETAREDVSEKVSEETTASPKAP